MYLLHVSNLHSLDPGQLIHHVPVGQCPPQGSLVSNNLQLPMDYLVGPLAVRSVVSEALVIPTMPLGSGWVPGLVAIVHVFRGKQF